jgi:hypothetical protein
MLLDGSQQIVRTPIVQEENPLPDAPQRCATELEAIGVALGYLIGESRSHVVHRVVAERVDRKITYIRVCRGVDHGQVCGGLGHYVTARTANIGECLESGGYRCGRRRGGTAGRRRRRSRS